MRCFHRADAPWFGPIQPLARPIVPGQRAFAVSTRRRSTTIVGASRLRGLLRSQNLPAKAVAAIARERLLRALVGRFLPRPWSWLVRIAANIALLPSAVLRDAGTVVAGVVPGMNLTPAPASAGTAPAATDPTSTAPVPTVGPTPAAPTTPPAPPFTVEVGEPTRDSDLLEPAVGREPTQMRYPAPKRSMAKKRR